MFSSFDKNDLIADPKVRVVYGHRGYGKTMRAKLLEHDGYTTNPWSNNAKGLVVIDAQPWDEAEKALRYAMNLERWLRQHNPGVQTKTFLRFEDWNRLSKLKPFLHLQQHAIELPPFQLGYDRQAVDISGKPVPMAQENPIAWVLGQPECEWLACALPHEDTKNRKVALHEAATRMTEYLKFRPGVFTRGLTARQFLNFCEVIRAVRRVGQASIEWSPLWLNGCREWVRRNST